MRCATGLRMQFRISTLGAGREHRRQSHSLAASCRCIARQLLRRRLHDALRDARDALSHCGPRNNASATSLQEGFGVRRDVEVAEQAEKE
jgi:hypothetical protein